MGFCCLWGFRRRRRECLTGSLSTRDMGPLDFFQGSELLVTGERVFNLILHIPSSPSSSFFIFIFGDLVVVLLSFSTIYLFMLFLFVGQWRLFLRMTQASLAGLLHFWATRLGWLTLSGRSKNPDQVSYFLFFNLSLFCYMIM